MLLSLRLLRPLAVGCLCLLAGCVSVTRDPRALTLENDGSTKAQILACAGLDPHVQGSLPIAALDPAAIRVLTWNIHKQADAGWQRDLTRFAGQHDLVLLQEATLEPALRGIIEGAGLRWAMASSFSRDDRDIGVMTAATVRPLAACTQRAEEPLLRLPKSAVVTWYPLQGRADSLAVVNVHAINFSLSLGAYRAQVEALGQTLTQHRGPIIFAGDMNTWTAQRKAAVQAVTARLGLTEIAFADDCRKAFLGHQLDHLYVRGLTLVESSALRVTSSDHNPVRATLRLDSTALASLH